MKNKTLIAFNLVLIVVLLLTSVAWAQTPTPTPTFTPSATNALQQTGNQAATRIAATRQAQVTPGKELLQVTIQPLITPTMCPECEDTEEVLGITFDTLVTGTMSILNWPRALAMSIADSVSTENATTYGEEVGTIAGSMISAVYSLYDDLSTIIPVDVVIVVSIRLLIFLIVAFMGLIARLRSVIKWW